jgi:hypothetical protein
MKITYPAVAATMAVALAGGAVAAVLMTHQASPAAQVIRPAAQSAPAHTAKAATARPASTKQASPAPAPTAFYSSQPAPAQPTQAAAPPPPAQPTFTNAVAVVDQYYQDITNQDYQAAWAIGGDHIAAQNGQTYASWEYGYSSTTSSISLTSSGTWSDGTVWCYLSALQLDGSVNDYYGTYTVTNGVITSADIRQAG